MAWVEQQAVRRNGTAPPIDVARVCGSSTETYLTELLHTKPADLSVLREWGDIVDGGRQVLINGTVTTRHLGPSDLPTSHAFGDDLSMDVALDAPFRPFAAQLGREREDRPANEMHVEISSGYLPHQVRPAVASHDATWREVSDHNLTGFLPGFDGPMVGDRVAVMGRWIVDCGHASYATELHPISFLAWAHDDGATTTVDVMMNPYRDTELYSPDAGTLGRVNDRTRAALPTTKPFPRYLLDEALRLVSNPTGHLRAQELIDATRLSPVDLRVCRPTASANGNGNGKVRVGADVVTRRDVDVRVRRDGAGCAVVTVTTKADYRAADVVTAQCRLPWSYLRVIAGAALGSNADIKALIDKNVPVLLRPLVDRDPDTTCADALAGPPVNDRPTTVDRRVDDGQPLALYGVVTVSRR